MRRKILSFIITLLLVFAVATPIFAWFYFPNSKGLEIDTPSADDFSVVMYKLENQYNEDGTFKNSYFVDLSKYKDTNNNNPYLTSNGFEVDEKYEFFEWGDEYICENSEPHYYAIECEYDSDIFNDGYVKSILTTSLKSVGANLETEDENNLLLAFPIVNVSYKFSSTASIMSSENDAINEIKSSNGYQDIINRYFKKDANNNFIELNSNTFDNTISKIYKRNLTEYTGDSFISGTTYYEMDYDDAVIFKITSDPTPNIQKRYFVGTFDEVSNLDLNYSSNQTYDYVFENNKSTTFYTDFENETARYINSTTKKLQFVLFIKVEPNESLVTDILYGIKDNLDDDLTEINIDNKLQFDVKLRSVPKKESTNS